MTWTVMFRVLLGFSLFALALPFAVQWIEGLIGVLVTQQEWAAAGHESGPWSGRWESFTLFLPSLALAGLIVIIAIFYAIRDHRFRSLVSGLGLLGLHAATLIIQLQALSWLVE